MKDLIIDEEFRELLPTLDKNTFALLEENVLENGIRDAIVDRGEESRTLEEVFTDIAETINIELLTLARDYNPVELKVALRGHIDWLEDIFRMM